MATSNEFGRQLGEAHDMERKLAVALEAMAAAATDDQLGDTFREHQRVTEVQAARIGQVFSMLGSAVGRVSCRGVDELVDGNGTATEAPELEGVDRDLAATRGGRPPGAIRDRGLPAPPVDGRNGGTGGRRQCPAPAEPRRGVGDGRATRGAGGAAQGQGCPPILFAVLIRRTVRVQVGNV